MTGKADHRRADRRVEATDLTAARNVTQRLNEARHLIVPYALAFDDDIALIDRRCWRLSGGGSGREQGRKQGEDDH